MKKTLHRFLATLLVCVLLSGCAALAEEPGVPGGGSAAHTVKGQTYPYLFQLSDESGDPVKSEMNLYFVDGGDIPYAALSEFMPMLSNVLEENGTEGIVYEINAGGNGDLRQFTVTRPDNGSVMFVYPDTDVLMFNNYNTFRQAVGSKQLVTVNGLPEVTSVQPMELVDFLTMPLEPMREQSDGAEESTGIFTLKQGFYLNRPGNVVTLELGNYGIDIVESEGECYIPFQTLNDLLINDEYFWFVFNGETVIGTGYQCSLINEMYSCPKHDLSETFAQFNFRELCLLLDCKYGLKAEHGIDSFYRFFANNPELLTYLSGTNAMKSSYAIAMLCYAYFDDMHSGFTKPSFLFENNPELERKIRGGYQGPSIRNSARMMGLYWDAREAFYPDRVPGYEEVGDTAFITFDEFQHLRSNYTMENIEAEDLKDTIDLIIYANRQIKREGSPIKNIVLDLSNNDGGSSNAAIFVMSWFLGEADVALRDTFTGAETNAVYLADVNLDSKFDAQDNVAQGYGLYCLTSPCSFSCGNLVPSACRSSGIVTLIGQTTGGGSCMVLPCTTAAGTVFQISGPLQMSTIRNGSFYNIDAGVEPDFRLSKPESFYDRPALVEYLHGLK